MAKHTYSESHQKSWAISNDKKSAQLGIPFGTAASRLKKIILFDLLRTLKRNICFQCGMTINSEKELSIEHKRPWLDVDPRLFWDMGNIAFSHLQCNCGASVRKGRSNIEQRKVGPEGMAWCRGHQDFLPTSNFGKNRFNWNGLQGECINCRSKRRSPKYWNSKNGAGSRI